MSSSLIQILFSDSGPFAVSGPTLFSTLLAVTATIIAIVVFALYGIVRSGFWPHSGFKSLKRIAPSLTYGDAPSSIPGIDFVGWTQAAGLHRTPNMMKRRIGLAVYAPLFCRFACSTSTTLRVFLPQCGFWNNLGRTAIAVTQPSLALILCSGQSWTYNNQPPEPLTKLHRGIKETLSHAVTSFQGSGVVRSTSGVGSIGVDRSNITKSMGEGKTNNGVSGGERRFIPALARAAMAVGVSGIFAECHLDPENARSDAATQWPISELKSLLESLLRIQEARG